jgi:hypothetical protein
MPNPTQTASGAAAQAVATAQAVAATGVAAGQLGYVLTTQALQEGQASMVFPLLALSVTAIVEGLAAYIAVGVLGKSAADQVAQRFADAEEYVASHVAA